MDTNDAQAMLTEAMKGKSVVVMNYYDILENDDKEVLFAIKCFDERLTENDHPVMYYDGGPHAILMKSDEEVAICDHVHPSVRGALAAVNEAIIVEHKDGEIVEEYMAEVQQVTGVEAAADSYVPPLEDQREEE